MSIVTKKCVELVSNLICKTLKQKDLLGTLKTFVKTIIPPYSVVLVKCKVKSAIIDKPQMLAVFKPYLNNHADLIFLKTVLKLSRGKASHIPVKIPMPNPIVLNPNCVIGTLNQLSVIIPLETYSKKVSSDIMDNSNVIIPKTNPVATEEQWLPKVDLSHLSHDQILLAETLCEKFDLISKTDSDIAKLNDWNLKINLKDITPVYKMYRSTSKQLYREVKDKEYLDDLFLNK